jgi:hypothetical protein
MTILEKFQEVANIKFVVYNGDVEIGTMNTADGYDIYYITSDVRNLNFDYDVFYYQPDFDTIMKYIDDNRTASEMWPIEVECHDIEEYFDEYSMLDYLQSNMDEKEFEKFTDK